MQNLTIDAPRVQLVRFSSIDGEKLRTSVADGTFGRYACPGHPEMGRSGAVRAAALEEPGPPQASPIGSSPI